MTNYRYQLPQLEPQTSPEIFITDGGLETDLIFLQGFHLPEFAAFVLLKNPIGTAALRRYFEKYVAIADQYEVGLVLESPTWRASRDWGERLGYNAAALDEVNRQAIALLQDIRDSEQPSEQPSLPMVISGCIGPRGDGYSPDSQMDAQSAQHYHQPQVNTFEAAGADMVSAITMTYAEEAIGIAWAAQEAGIPVVISFTVETDGRLPSGQSLKGAIEQVDSATNSAPAYYMINCAHPTHFQSVISAGEAWVDRIYGLRANASRKSHAELDEAETLDDGNPQELGTQYVALKAQLHNLTVLGGCCGTDARHIEAICEACFPTIPEGRTVGVPCFPNGCVKEVSLFDSFLYL
ncbi:MAG: homocysteine S-methyltransferase family protein [Cyanobacteria bacterium J06597_16]